MAKANPVEQKPLQPEVQPQDGLPEIIYHGVGAEDVKFTPNPLAKRIVVKAGGTIMEYL